MFYNKVYSILSLFLSYLNSVYINYIAFIYKFMIETVFLCSHLIQSVYHLIHILVIVLKAELQYTDLDFESSTKSF